MTGERGAPDSDAWRALVAAGEAILASAAPASPALQGAAIVALGWATVEIARAEIELGAVIGSDEAWAEAPPDAVLGARAAVCRPQSAAGPVVVLLEPDTEGRLAASLARHGEGVAAIYVTRSREMTLAPGSFGIPAGGPLGRARRLAGGGSGEPSILVLDADPRSP